MLFYNPGVSPNGSFNSALSIFDVGGGTREMTAIRAGTYTLIVETYTGKNVRYRLDTEVTS